MQSTNVQRSQFATLWARHYVQQQTEKRLFGKPYVKFGALLTICSFLFQQAGLLGRAFRETPVPFFEAFLAPEGHAEKAIAGIRQTATTAILPYLEKANTIHRLVIVRQMDQWGEKGDWSEWFLKRGMERIRVDTAMKLAWMHQLEAAGFGMEHPDRFEELFKNSYKQEDPNEWRSAYEFAVVDTPEQPKLPIEEAEHESVEIFAEYCKEFYPHLLRPLGLGD